MWGSALLKSWSTTQTTIATSSAEAELYAMCKCSQQMLGMVSFAADLNITLKVKVFSDASAALGIAHRSGLGGKSRHIKVQYLWVQQVVAERALEIGKVATRDNMADVLTKFLGVEAHGKHCSAAGISFEDLPVGSLAGDDERRMLK